MTHEQELCFDAVGGSNDLLLSAAPGEGVTLSITDVEGEVVIIPMTPAEAFTLQRALLTCANVANTPGGAA